MDLWTTGGLTPPDDVTQAEMRRLHDEIVAIRALGDEDACRICGSRDLSEEHTPSRRAGNIHRVYRGGLDDTETLARGELRFDLELLQGGVTIETICTKCNNDSGRRYNPAYIRLVNVSGPFATFPLGNRTRVGDSWKLQPSAIHRRQPSERQARDPG